MIAANTIISDLIDQSSAAIPDTFKNFIDGANQFLNQFLGNPLTTAPTLPWGDAPTLPWGTESPANTINDAFTFPDIITPILPDEINNFIGDSLNNIQELFQGHFGFDFFASVSDLLSLVGLDQNAGLDQIL